MKSHYFMLLVIFLNSSCDFYYNEERFESLVAPPTLDPSVVKENKTIDLNLAFSMQPTMGDCSPTTDNSSNFITFSIANISDMATARNCASAVQIDMTIKDKTSTPTMNDSIYCIKLDTDYTAKYHKEEMGQHSYYTDIENIQIMADSLSSFALHGFDINPSDSIRSATVLLRVSKLQLPSIPSLTLIITSVSDHRNGKGPSYFYSVNTKIIIKSAQLTPCN